MTTLIALGAHVRSLNYLAPFLLTNMLLNTGFLMKRRPHERRGCHHRAEDEMRRRQPPRVATVS